MRDGFSDEPVGRTVMWNDYVVVGPARAPAGILPTLAEGHMNIASLSGNPRYKLLSEQILDARGEDITIAIDGTERIRTTADSIVPETVTTSPAETVRDGRRESSILGNAAGKNPGRRADGKRASALWKDCDVRKSMNARAPWMLTAGYLRGLIA